MSSKIHLFNPGHETAILVGTKNYTPPTNVQRMTRELACLPLWYADTEDYVLTEDPISTTRFHFLAQQLGTFATVISRKELETGNFQHLKIEATPWGLSPHSLFLFEKIKKKGKLNLRIPSWKEEYASLTNRRSAARCLDIIRQLVPTVTFPVTPVFCRDIISVEAYLQTHQVPCVIKTPFSSSGRGLLWLNHPQLTPKEQAWIEGALHKQGEISIEPTLKKHQDFAMEFYSDGKGMIQYEGLSVFGAGNKGAYSGNRLGNTNYLEEFFITKFGDQFHQIKKAVQEAIRQIYGECYTGYLGVDMMVYHNETKETLAIHPCIEVNMRYTMGLLALHISRKYLAQETRGEMVITYENESGKAYQQHLMMKKEYPLLIKNKRICSGYLSLCPVTEETKYRAYLIVQQY